MINHGELMAQLKAATPTGREEHNELVARLTAGGVIMEGGPLQSNVLPTTPAGNIMRSDLGMILHKDFDSVKPMTAPGLLNTGFKLGAGSMKELSGVNPTLVHVVQRAIQLTTQDFCVYDGIRSVKEQQAHVTAGTSKTMQSKHLSGLAVDLVPWINGKPVWDWTGCYKIAFAMDLSATEAGVAAKIRWGGAWDRTLADFGGDLGSYAQEVTRYRARHVGPDFVDGPHFEILS